MKSIIRIVAVLAVAALCGAEEFDLESVALEALTGKPLGPENCFVGDTAGRRVGSTAGFSMEQIRTATNSPACLALLAAKRAAAASKRDADADLTNSDVRLRAAAVEIVAEIEKIKTAVRTLHPAAASALPERTAAEWEAAIKARAKAMQQ